MKDIQDLMEWINGCIKVIIDNKGDVFTTGKEVGQLQVYLYELNKILNKPLKEEITDTPPNPTKNVIVGGIEYLSPRDVWEREKKAFEAARCKLNFYSLSPFPGDKYPTFEDYKKDGHRNRDANKVYGNLKTDVCQTRF